MSDRESLTDPLTDIELESVLGGIAGYKSPTKPPKNKLVGRSSPLHAIQGSVSLGRGASSYVQPSGAGPRIARS